MVSVQIKGLVESVVYPLGIRATGSSKDFPKHALIHCCGAFYPFKRQISGVFSQRKKSRFTRLAVFRASPTIVALHCVDATSAT